MKRKDKREDKARVITATIIIFVVVVLIATSVTFLFIEQIMPLKRATVAYNQAVDDYNFNVDRYNELAERLKVPDYGLSDLSAGYDKLQIQDEEVDIIFRAWIEGTRTLAVEQDTEIVKGFKEDVIENIRELQEVIPMQNAIKEYNEVAESYNILANKYNKKVVKADVTGVLPVSFNYAEIQDTDIDFVYRMIKTGDSLPAVNNDINYLNSQKTIISNDIAILENIIAPSAEWVYATVTSVEGVEKAQIVTEEDNEKLQLFPEDSGYIGCVYFILKDIGDDKFQGNMPIERGTDGGGAIEIYDTLERARTRCNYLSGFDNGILESGSYMAFGTMVIRISHVLNDDARLAYSMKLIEEMCAISES